MHKPPAAADSPSPFENHEPEIIAAVDLGSNSFHMIDDELRVAILLCFAVRLYRSRKPDVVPIPGLRVAEKG